MQLCQHNDFCTACVCPGDVSSGVEDPASHLSVCAVPAPSSGLWLMAWCRNCVLRHSCFLHAAGSCVAPRVSKYLQNSRFPSAGREPGVETHPMGPRNPTQVLGTGAQMGVEWGGGKDQIAWQMGRGEEQLLRCMRLQNPTPNLTSPRCESPRGPLVSVCAMMTFTPGRIWKENRAHVKENTRLQTQ